MKVGDFTALPHIEFHASENCTTVVVKNPADFIGSALGESESKTKAILATTVGKVLIIDEVCEFPTYAFKF